MRMLYNFVHGNILYSMLTAVILLIIGCAIALKAGKAWGWLIVAAAAALAFYSARVNGLL